MSTPIQALLRGPAHEIAAAVRRRDVSVCAITEASIARIEATDGRVNAFTQRTVIRAMAEATPPPADDPAEQRPRKKPHGFHP